MDFSNRTGQPQATAPAAQGSAAGSPSPANKKNKGKFDWGRLGVVVAVGAVVILLVALLVLLSVGGKNKNESKYIDTSKLQAVFLNTGQVYFGNIKTLNDEYLVLTNIYYLQTSNSGQDNANANVTLVKLGCELHEPLDQMVINSEQITFWENLGDNGQVATAVSTFQKQNPDGQKCADQSSSSSTDATQNTQNAGPNSGGTNTNDNP